MSEPLRGQGAPVRLANIAFVTALLCLACGAAALLALRPFASLPGDLAQIDRRNEVLALLREGHERMRAADWAGAIEAYGQAEQLAPELPGPRRMRQLAFQSAADHTRQVAREQAVGGNLELARLAMMTRRYAEAETAVRAVLAVDGANAEAKQILATLEAERRKPVEPKVATRRPQAALPTPQPSLPPPAPAPTTPAPVEPADPAKTQLYVDFHTDLPAGTLIVYVNNRQVMREQFDFYERRGLRRIAKRGRVQDWIRITPGAARVRVLATPQGGSGNTEELLVDFPSGQQSRLVVRLDGDGRLTAQMN